MLSYMMKDFHQILSLKLLKKNHNHQKRLKKKLINKQLPIFYKDFLIMLKIIFNFSCKLFTHNLHIIYTYEKDFIKKKPSTTLQ